MQRRHAKIQGRRTPDKLQRTATHCNTLQHATYTECRDAMEKAKDEVPFWQKLILAKPNMLDPEGDVCLANGLAVVQVSLSLCLPPSLPLFLSLSLYLSLPPFLPSSLFFSPSLSLSFSLSVHSLSLSFTLSFSLTHSQSLFPSLSFSRARTHARARP